MGRLENLKPFEVGNPGGPGRPKGSRAKLSELAATLLYENFTVNGAETIERVRQKKPEVYLASVIALLPKQAQKVESPFVDISDAELEALEAHLAAVRAKLVSQVEGTVSRVANTAPETHGPGIQIELDVHKDQRDTADTGASLSPERNVDAVDDAA